MTNRLRFLSVVVGRLTIQLKGQELDEQSLPRELKYSVIVNHRRVGEISFFEFNWPSIAVHQPFVFVWGGSRLFCLSSETGELRTLLEDRDEILALYPLTQGWCIVGETSLEVYDESFSECKQSLGLDEIILESWWEDGKLYLRDLEERVIRIEPENGHVRLCESRG